MRSVIMLAVCLIGCPPLVVADEMSKRAMAEECIKLMGVEKQMSEQFVLMRQMQKAQLERMEQMQPSSQAGSSSGMVMGKMMDMLAEGLSWDSLKETVVSIYAETFTEDELRGAIEFYKSPAGQKWIEKSPELTKRVMEVAQRRTQELTPRILEMLKAEHEGYKQEAVTSPSRGSGTQ